MTKLIRGFGSSLSSFFIGRSTNNSSGLVRMFETEYAKEARFARNAGCDIDDIYVKSFLASHK